MAYLISLLLLAILYFNNQQKTKANKVLRRALNSLNATQQQLIAQKERAEQGEQFKQRFLAHISHEIRTPLHGIAGFADLLLETALTEKQRRWLFSIYHSNERLNEVVNDVLELSRNHWHSGHKTRALISCWNCSRMFPKQFWATPPGFSKF